MTDESKDGGGNAEIKNASAQTAKAPNGKAGSSGRNTPGGPPKQNANAKLGKIYGDVGVLRFTFAVSDPSTKKDEYVQVKHEDAGYVLCRITDLKRKSDVTLDKIDDLEKLEKLKDAQMDEGEDADDVDDDDGGDEGETGGSDANDSDTESKDSDEEDGLGDSGDDDKELPGAKKPQGADESDGAKLEDGKLTAIVSVLGYKDERGIIQMPDTPFKPGSIVMRADESLVKAVLGLRTPPEKGAYIGFLKGHETRIYLDINTLVQKHMSVLAKTGAGKSYAVGVVLEELLDKHVPLVIMDPHGEYSAMREPNDEPKDIALMERFGIEPHGFADQVVEYSFDTKINRGARDLKFSSTDLKPNEILDLAGIKGTANSAVVYQAMKYLEDNGKKKSLTNLIQYLKDGDENGSKWNVINSLETLLTLGLFGERGTPTTELVKHGQATVINFRGIPPNIQEIAVQKIAIDLFEMRKRGEIPPVMLVLEEVHNFAPQQGTALCSKILRTIAAEGRKFGLGMCIVSQRPAKVDKSILSQCNTQIILKVTNPNDLKAIINSVEGLTAGLDEEVQKLIIGTGVVCGGSIATPILVEFRARRSKHGGKSIDVLAENDDAAGQAAGAAAQSGGAQFGDFTQPQGAPSSADAGGAFAHIYKQEDVRLVRPAQTQPQIEGAGQRVQLLKPLSEMPANSGSPVIIHSENVIVNIPPQSGQIQPSAQGITGVSVVGKREGQIQSAAKQERAVQVLKPVPADIEAAPLSAEDSKKRQKKRQ